MKRKCIRGAISFIAVVMCICLVWTNAFATRAEENTEENTEEVTEENTEESAVPEVVVSPPKILSANAYETKVITLTMELEFDEFDVFYVYRSKYKDKGFKLLDRLSYYGLGSGVTTFNGVKTIDSEYNKIVWKRTSSEDYFIDKTTKLGETYYYKIKREDEDGNMSDWSNVASATSSLEPVLLDGSYAVDKHTVLLKWNKVKNAKGYYIFQKQGKKWKRIARVSSKKNKYTVKKLAANKTYKFYVTPYCKVKGKIVKSEQSYYYIIKTKNPTVKGNYSYGSVYGPYISESKLLEVKRVVQAFKDNYYSSKMKTVDKAWVAYTYLQMNCSYAYRGWQYNDANTAWGALVYGEAQCSGYARAYKALCDAIGVPCYYVHANNNAINPSHQWNMVKIGKKWYIVDAQAGIFLVGSNTWRGMGLDWDSNGLPKCSRTDY